MSAKVCLNKYHQNWQSFFADECEENELSKKKLKENQSVLEQEKEIVFNWKFVWVKMEVRCMARRYSPYNNRFLLYRYVQSIYDSLAYVYTTECRLCVW